MWFRDWKMKGGPLHSCTNPAGSPLQALAQGKIHRQASAGGQGSRAGARGPVGGPGPASLPVCLGPQPCRELCCSTAVPLSCSSQPEGCLERARQDTADPQRSAAQKASVRSLGFLFVCWKGFPSGSAGKESTCNVGDLGSIPGMGRSPGEGKGYPL